jgi:hypothetical protein
MVTLSLQGYTVAEISGRTRRTVQRVSQRIRHRLERLQSEDAQERRHDAYHAVITYPEILSSAKFATKGPPYAHRE